MVRSIVDEGGNRVFRDQDAALLQRKSASALMRLFNVASRLSGVGDDDVEELVGNSDTTPNDGSDSS